VKALKKKGGGEKGGGGGGGEEADPLAKAAVSLTSIMGTLFGGWISDLQHQRRGHPCGGKKSGGEWGGGGRSNTVSVVHVYSCFRLSKKGGKKGGGR